MNLRKPFSARALLVVATTAWLGVAFPGMGTAQLASIKPASEENPVLQPGDLIRLRIWREPDLSGDYRVDEEGVAIFPKIGPLPVARLSTGSLKRVLLSRYDRYLRNPSVEVTFLRRVNVLGSVKNPGLYDVDPTMTVADVVAIAGGVTADGNPKKIELYRQGQPSTRISEQSRLANVTLRSGDHLHVPQRGWLSRNGTVVAAGITAIGLITTAVVR